MSRKVGEPGDAIVLAREPDFRLGEVEVRPALLQLARDGRCEAVEPRVMQALVALARSPGAVTTIDELVARCWAGRVVGDGAIHRVMSRIHRLAEGIGAGAFHLESIPRVGYRLVVDARDPAPHRSTSGGRTPWPWLVGLAGGLAMLLAVASWRGGRPASGVRAVADTAAVAPCDGADPALHRMHMQARVLLGEPTPTRLDQALVLLDEVVIRDPGCARALAGQAFAWRTKAIVAEIPPRTAFAHANAAIDRALAIDPGLAEAHSERGWHLMWHDWDWPAAEQAFLQAIALEPELAEAHRGYAHLLATLGHSEQALARADLALQGDPTSGLSNTQRGQFLLAVGRTDDALRQLEHTLRVRPGFWIALLHRGEATGNIEDLELAVEASQGNSIAIAWLGRMLARNGQVARAEALLGQLLERTGERYVPQSTIAGLQLALGRREAAMDAYERAYAERDLILTFLGARARYQHPLREDPRFIALLRRLDLYEPPQPAGAPEPAATP